MSAYTTQASVEGRIAPPLLINALDDGTSGGNLNTAVLNQIISDVSAELDGYLASIYPVPWGVTVPPAVSEACLTMVCSVIYGRRLSPGQSNPWLESAEKWRTEIENYGKGNGNLGPNFPRTFAPGFGVQEFVSFDMNTA